ncbi:MAG: DUF6106 family protein [Hespellia sp.]|nr:DUF6106 family protein [Hespellia sp.]
MNDTFCEHIVQRKTRPTDIAIKVLSIAAIVVLALSSVILGFLMIFVAFIFGTIAVLFIFPKLKVEYEYSLLNHDLNVDVIYNRAKRKHLLSIDLKEAEMIAPRTSHRLDAYHDLVMKDYSTADENATPYAVMCNISQQMNCILFNPDKEMLSRMESFLPRTLYRD